MTADLEKALDGLDYRPELIEAIAARAYGIPSPAGGICRYLLRTSADLPGLGSVAKAIQEDTSTREAWVNVVAMCAVVIGQSVPRVRVAAVAHGLFVILREYNALLHKYGRRNHPLDGIDGWYSGDRSDAWLVVALEEAGEVATAIDESPDAVGAELAQLGAVALSALEADGA